MKNNITNRYQFVSETICEKIRAGSHFNRKLWEINIVEAKMPWKQKKNDDIY